MKTRFVPIMTMFAAVYLQAQASPLPFQWHGQTMAVDFELTNLTASVQIVIRDDIAYSMSLIPSTNVNFSLLLPASSYYGKYSGSAHFDCNTPINYCEGVLCYYTTVGTNICWQIEPQVCSNYLAAIAVTNQHATAVNAFSNYLHQFTTGIDTSNMTLTEKKALLWNPPLVQLLEETSATEFEELIGGAIPAVPAPPGACPAPSILAFKVETDLPQEWCPPLLCCNVKVWRGASGRDIFRFCFVNSTWRFSPAGP